MIRISILLVMFLAPIFSFAGGWISSGGESLIYARNPWFVKNTKSVDYCIQMDESSFSISRNDAEKLIAEGFQYWKSEFANNGSPGNGNPGFTQIASQTFHFVAECQDKTPLIFKLGLKKLNAEEIKYLDNPKKFIGVTIRKEYSLETLTGRGVIYLTADTGADAYTNDGQMLAEAWKKPILFRYALIHELGHFFGVPHVGSGIMSEVFMTVLLNKRMVPYFESTAQLSFLNPPANFEVCRGSASFNPDFFGVPKDTICLKFESIAGAQLQWNVFKKEEGNAVSASIGTVQVTSLDQSPYALKPAVIVQLPQEQKVFTAVETILGSFLVGGVFSDTSFMGGFRPQGSLRVFPLQMSLSAEKMSFVGTVQNQQMTVMNYSQLSFMQGILN